MRCGMPRNYCWFCTFLFSSHMTNHMTNHMYYLKTTYFLSSIISKVLLLLFIGGRLDRVGLVWISYEVAIIGGDLRISLCLLIIYIHTYIHTHIYTTYHTYNKQYTSIPHNLCCIRNDFFWNVWSFSISCSTSSFTMINSHIPEWRKRSQISGDCWCRYMECTIPVSSLVINECLKWANSIFLSSKNAIFSFSKQARN